MGKNLENTYEYGLQEINMVYNAKLNPSYIKWGRGGGNSYFYFIFPQQIGMCFTQHSHWHCLFNSLGSV